MDDQKTQPTDQAASGQPADPMAGTPAMPQMPPMPPMPTTDGGAGGMNAGANPTTEPAAAPAAPAMDAMNAGMSAPAVEPAPVVPSAGGASSPATLDEVMAELRKIEDKLVEMDEKL